MGRQGVLIRVPNEQPVEGLPEDVIMAGDFYVASPSTCQDARVSDHNIWQHLSQYSLVPHNLAVDLYILAAGSYVADQRIPRRIYGEDSWSRLIDLFVPVSDPELWAQQADLVSHILGFLSGDYWRVHFRSRGVLPEFRHAGQTMATPNTDCVSLFSGGLDSFIGGINLLENGKNPIFVGQYSSPDVSASQTRCFEAINRQYPDRGMLFSARVYLPKVLLYGVQENTMRSRSLLFLALGSLLASSLERPATLIVPENGFISLNIPLSLHRLGALSTKTTHPHLMQSFQTLLNQLNLPITLTNPFQFKTKGQMVAECSNQEFLRETVSGTMSCSHPAQARFARHSPRDHCGTCVPCLIRKAAIHAAWGQDTTTYIRNDLVTLGNDHRQARNANVKDILAAIEKYRQQNTVTNQQLLLSGPLPDRENMDRYRQVYMDGLGELASVLGVNA